MNTEAPIINAAGPKQPAETPSGRIIRESNEIRFAANPGPRKIGVRQADLLSQFRFVQAMGDTISANKTWMTMATPILMLASIDGDNVRQPMNYREMEALIQRLGNDGYAELQDVMTEVFGDQGGDDAATDTAVKNS